MTYCIDWQMDSALGLRVPVLDLEREADARRLLAHAATLESYALLEMLQREQQRGEGDLFGYVFSTTVRRLLELNGAVCGAFSTGPGLDSPAEIADVIFGANGWRDSRNPGDTEPTKTFEARTDTSNGGGAKGGAA